jgi:NAD(P)-dependent dehydrogenase (short-subunit alcohol dehydrogenase family)
MDFQDKVAIVTGGGTGLGRSLALGLCRKGAMVVLAGRRREKLEAVVAECGRDRMRALPTDVTRYLSYDGWSRQRCRRSAGSTWS